VVAWHEDEPLRTLLGPYADARVGDMVPLRLFAAIHRLVLERQAGELGTFMPSVGGTPPNDDLQRERMCRTLLAVIDAHRDEIAGALTRIPQTNEVGRAVGLAALLRRLRHAFALPVDLHEIGCSAGLSLRVDALVDAGVIRADHAEWGALPDIAGRDGIDLAPVDASTPSGRTLLTSFVWTDQIERFERLRQALRVADQVDVDLVRADAVDSVRGLVLRPGRILVVWHSAMWLYLAPDERSDIRAALEELGAAATAGSPLAHAWLEPVAENEGGEHQFTLAMATWPGIDGVPAGVEVPWGHAPPSGEPVAWNVPCAGAIVRDPSGRILLVRRGQAPSRGLWSVPGGRVEPGEDWAEAAVREVREETGIVARHPEFVGIVERDSEAGTTYLIADYAMTGDGEPRAGDDALEARWCEPDELRLMPTTPGLVEALRGWGLIDEE
jgi:ADP-ribose pyrophosphatase YjhB (NUDIX family)